MLIIPSKPARYGIKIYALVDSKLFYVFTLEVYAGKQPEGPFQVSNKPEDVVKRLLEPLYNTGRNITTDNWFSSIDLMLYLRDKNLSFVGTLKKINRKYHQNWSKRKGDLKDPVCLLLRKKELLFPTFQKRIRMFC